MVSTFLHQDSAHSPDELAGEKPPLCAGCDKEMWLTSVTTTVGDDGADGVYTYECKTCGAREKVMRHTDRADGLPVASEL